MLSKSANQMINSSLFTRLSKPLDFSRTAVRTDYVRFFLIAGLTGLLVGCSDHLNPTSRKVQEAVDKVRTDLEKSLGNSVPSLSVLIQTPSQRIFVSSVPVGQTPASETAYFRFGSNTKNFTATAILNMHEDGWLNYKAKITDLMPGTNMPYVPNTPAWDFPYKNDITIEQLLQHSAGVYDVDNDPVPGFNGISYTHATQTADPTHQFSTEEMVHQLILHKLSYFAPGTDYHYSNTGYSMLGEIIKRVYSARSGSAKTYGDYLHDYVVGPNAPVPVSIHFPRADDVVLPAPRVEGTERDLTQTIMYGDYNMSAHVAEGNGIGTMAALNTYIRTLMKGQNVLRPETVKLMQTNVPSATKSIYALGCIVTPNLGYGHAGARIGNISVMVYDPLTDVSVVAYLPLWDLAQGPNMAASFQICMDATYDAAYAARAALGYPGEP